MSNVLGINVPDVLDPFFGPLASDVRGKINNDLVPATKVHLSAILSRNGWGAPNSQLNRQARSIVYRESRGNPRAYNKIPCGSDCNGPFSPGNAVGFFQICDKCHAGKLGSPTTKEAFRTWAENPDNNAKLGKLIHSEAGWQPWSSSGSTPSGTSWDPTITTNKGTATDTLSGIADVVTEPINIIGDVAGALLNPSTWARIGKGLLGGILVIMGTGGLVYVIGNKVNPAISTVAKTVIK